MPLTLRTFPARTLTNPQFDHLDLSALDCVYLPPGVACLHDESPLKTIEFIEDDNRGAVSPDPVATLDGVPFYLSVKGVGSTVDPFSLRPLDRKYAAELTADEHVRARLELASATPPDGETERMITGESWLRGSPYGGQGLEHARIALEVSKRAELTSIAGFLIAPVVKIAFLPPVVQERLRTLHWYRSFRGEIVQELRLVPSNIRIYFHAKNTVGNNAAHVLDLFGIDTEEKTLQFEVQFIRSAMAMLTLFPRTLRFDPQRERYFGLEFHDVWLDKDAVMAPSGSVYFVDLEGIEEEGVDREKVTEKIEDQLFRSLYEFVFAYEQLEMERLRRFGRVRSRKGHFATLLREALHGDPFLRLNERSDRLELEILNALGEKRFNTLFPILSF